jgi:hypothetical protein
MTRVTVTAAALLPFVAAGPAAADWVFRPSEASDDFGSAYVQNAQGHVFDVGCGNGGEISLQLRADVRGGPADQEFTFVFPGMEGMLAAPFQCEAGICSSGYQYPNGQAWTEKQKAYLIDALKREPEVSVYRFTDRHTLISSFTLKGSTAALGRLEESARNCVGL